MPALSRQLRDRRAAPRRRRLLLEPLEDRSLLAAVITVNSPLDANDRDDALTLREAILISNRTLAVATLSAAEQALVSGAPTDTDTDTIAFNISGEGVQYVQTYDPSIGVPPPTITDPVVIDGYTQPGASPNTNGPGQGDNAVLMIQLVSGAGGVRPALTIGADNSTVRGFAIEGFQIAINVLAGHSNNVIEGNFIGVSPSGMPSPCQCNGVGVFINAGAKNNVVGGTSPAARNVISHNTVALSVLGSENTVAGNIIGLDASGTIAVGRENRFLVEGDNNLIGGTTPGSRNVISGNTVARIEVTSQERAGPNAVSGTKIQGNFIGTDITGTVALGTLSAFSDGIHFGFFGAVNTLIGGTVPGAGNLISGNTNGIDTVVSSLTGTVIQGNYIGTDVTGLIPLGNAQQGIRVAGESLIGGTGTGIGVLGADAFAGNLIAANGGAALSAGPAAVIQGNVIGTTRTGMPLGNGYGLFISGPDSIIGGSQPGQGNIIANTADSAITISSYPGPPTSILGNSIFNNAGLGIDLGGDGPTPNDAGDADTGPNNLQNFPVISAAASNGGQLSVSYAVQSDPANSQYPIRVQFFKADADGQEGQVFLGDDLYEATEAGTVASIVFTPLVPLAAGDKIVATATDNFGIGSTSEFSPGVTLPLCSTLVVNTNDSGPGSLRDAILCANTMPGIDTISFNIPGTGVHTMSPASALPNITDSVIIDGYTQPGAMPNTNAIDDPDPDKRGFSGVPLIELEGSQAGNATGLKLEGAPNSIIRGLIINRWNIGIGFHPTVPTTGVKIEGNFLGTDATGTAGTAGLGNGTGIQVYPFATGITIGGTTPAARNVISNNGPIGIELFTTDSTIQGNLIGTDKSGTTALGNLVNSVSVHLQGIVHDANNQIGGTAAGSRNVLAGGMRIWFGSAGNRVEGNFIGVDVTGNPFITGARIVIEDSPNNTIGGISGNAGNLIGGGGPTGVVVHGPTATGNAILSNSIFRDLGIDLGNDGATANDTDDADTGPNNLQNFPQIGYATKSGGLLKVTYTLPSNPANSTYPMRIEFFQAEADGQQGQTYLGFDTFTADDFAAGGKTIAFSPLAQVKLHDKIVATATEAGTGQFGGTSEFSPQAVIASPWVNPRKRLDVNDDTHVASNDVVAIVNYINGFHPGPVPDDAVNAPLYYDTNDDGFVAPNDLVQVINAINARLDGEGEAAAPPTSGADLIALLAQDAVEQIYRRKRHSAN